LREKKIVERTLRFHVIHTESSDGWGGQEMRILLEAKELLRRGHNVTVVCPPQSGLSQRTLREDIPTIQMKFHHVFDVPAMWNVMGLAKNRDIHIIHTHSSVDSWVASIASKMARVPVLVRTRHLLTPIPNHMFNFVYKLPDAIVTTGESIRRGMVEVNRLDGDKIFSIPTGVELDKFDPHVGYTHLREELNISQKNPVITMVAVLRQKKRHDVFLEAAKYVLGEYPNAKFLIVGEGPVRGRIEKKIEELELRGSVLLTGHREDIPEILSGTDVAVLTSESEGMPQSVLQYLAMEKPVVATDAGSVSDAVRNGETGILVPPNNFRGVAEGILALLNDRELGRRLGSNGRKLIKRRFSYEIMTEKILELYGRLYMAKVEQRV
jgi:glycosyltransferase involved in cell wall biosynthesis